MAFDGIDTATTVELIGHVLGHTTNMDRVHRFDVGPSLRGGDKG